MCILIYVPTYTTEHEYSFGFVLRCKNDLNDKKLHEPTLLWPICGIIKLRTSRKMEEKRWGKCLSVVQTES